MPDRDLKLNSLSRYTKSSPHFVLEEYGSCEVPAGCGGVILRWRDPDEALPLLIRLYTPGKCKAYLDGEPIRFGRPPVKFGEHVLSFELSHLRFRRTALMFAAIYDEDTLQDGSLGDLRVSRASGHRAAILSAPDGTWRFSAREPRDDDWLQYAYDDSGWTPMILLETAPETPGTGFTMDRVQQFGTRGLGVDPPCPKVWVRKRFTLERQVR